MQNLWAIGSTPSEESSVPILLFSFSLLIQVMSSSLQDTSLSFIVIWYPYQRPSTTESTSPGLKFLNSRSKWIFYLYVVTVSLEQEKISKVLFNLCHNFSITKHLVAVWALSKTGYVCTYPLSLADIVFLPMLGELLYSHQ